MSLLRKGDSGGLHGLLITIEGVDGAGKSTVAKMLTERLKALHPTREIVCVREPGFTAVGEQIRSIVLNTTENIRPMTEFLLFSAARSHLFDQVIVPALNRNAIVVQDRNWFSSYAYQGRGSRLCGEDVVNDLLVRLSMIVSADKGPHSQVAVRLLVSPEVDAKRRAERDLPADRFEKRDAGFKERVARGYEILDEVGLFDHTIDTDNRPPEEVVEIIYQKAVSEILSDADIVARVEGYERLLADFGLTWSPAKNGPSHPTRAEIMGMVDFAVKSKMVDNAVAETNPATASPAAAHKLAETLGMPVIGKTIPPADVAPCDAES